MLLKQEADWRGLSESQRGLCLPSGRRCLVLHPESSQFMF